MKLLIIFTNVAPNKLAKNKKKEGLFDLPSFITYYSDYSRVRPESGMLTLTVIVLPVRVSHGRL